MSTYAGKRPDNQQEPASNHVFQKKEAPQGQYGHAVEDSKNMFQRVVLGSEEEDKTVQKKASPNATGLQDHPQKSASNHVFQKKEAPQGQYGHAVGDSKNLFQRVVLGSEEEDKTVQKKTNPNPNARGLQDHPQESAPNHVFQKKEAPQGQYRHAIGDSKNLFQRVVLGSEEEDKTVQKKVSPNATGLPDNLKSGIENLSGYAMEMMSKYIETLLNQPSSMHMPMLRGQISI